MGPDAAGGTTPAGDEPRRIEKRLSAVEHELVNLRRDLHEYESRVSLDRLLAGVGLIVGVTGVAAFLLGRRATARQAHGD
jgi:hypothetical protein